MSINGDVSLFLLANAVATFLCSGSIVYLLYTKKIKRHLLFHFWALGFFLYGTEIALRFLSNINFIPYRADLLVLLLYLAFFMFPAGLWSLSHRKQIFYLIVPVYITGFIAFGLFLNGLLPQKLISASISSLFFYLPVAITLLDHRRLFGDSLDKITIGWLLLFFLNLSLPLDSWFLDALVVFSNFLILLGILDYDFIILVNDIRNGITPRLPPIDTGYRKEGGLVLAKYSSVSYPRNIEWITKKIKENSVSCVASYLFCFQDTISHAILRSLKWIDPERIFILLFSKNSPNETKEFKVIPVGITEIGAAISEIIKNQNTIENGCEIILANFSVLIHVFGVQPCYNLLLSKIGELRQSGITLFVLLSPATHSDKYVIPLFSNISDKVMEI